MEGITLRAATEADIEILKGFEQGVIEAERPFDPMLKPDPIHYYDLPTMLENESCYIAVAELDGKPIASGYARIERAKPYKQYSFYAYVGFIFVELEWRGKGVVGQMLSHLETWALEQGINVFHLDVFADNHSAIRAYEKAGYLPNLIDMRKVTC